MRARLCGALLACLVVTACVGERPTLRDPEKGGGLGEPLGNAAVDAVLAHLESKPLTPFTASYTITNRIGGESADAVLAVNQSNSSLTVGDTRFLRTDRQVTCNVVQGTCADGWNDQQIARLGVTSEFAQMSSARRLRVSYQTRSAEPTSQIREIAGRTSDCVSIPITAGIETYCATPTTLALMETPDVTIELTAIFDLVNADVFTPQG